MTIQETKEKYIKLFDKLEYDRDFTEVTKDFINSYNGTNEEEFSALLMMVLLLVMETQKFSTKAKGYDDLEDKHADFKAAFTKIKDDFENLSKGNPLATPPLVTTMHE